MVRQLSFISLLAAGALALPTVTTAASITQWNTSNVDVGAVDSDPNDDIGGASVIYDQDVSGGVPPGATSNGQIVYIAPESNSPGLKVVQEGYDVFDGCIMAFSTATCTSPFQSGKRIKQQVTNVGTIDLQFDVEADGQGESIYQVYHRLINVTGGKLDGFEVELGFGIGDSFQASGSNDGLRFANVADGVEFGPDNVAAFSQYPFGLFGGVPLNPNPLNLPGFFDTVDRAGMNVILNEDSILSNGYYGSYDARFGSWLSQEDVPDGLLYDYDPGVADPLVMAWASVDGWEFLRGIDLASVLNPLGVEPIASMLFAYDYAYDPINGISAAMEAYMAANLVDINGNPLVFGDALDVAAIEDLANLNLTFAIAVDDRFAGQYDSFTLRVLTNEVSPVPLPAGVWLMIAGLGALGVAGRRTKRA